MWTISAASATQVSEIDRSAASSRAVRACAEWWIRAGNERIDVSFSCLQIRRICVFTAFPMGPGRCRRWQTRFLQSCPSRRSASTFRATACSAATREIQVPAGRSRRGRPRWRPRRRIRRWRGLGGLICRERLLPLLHQADPGGGGPGGGADGGSDGGATGLELQRIQVTAADRRRRRDLGPVRPRSKPVWAFLLLFFVFSK